MSLWMGAILNMNWKNKIWRYVTFMVVVLFLLNPEMASLGLFIDAVGLDLFIMLMQLQILALLSGYYQYFLKRLSGWYNCLCKNNQLAVMSALKKEFSILFLTMSAPAVAMQAMVVCVISITLTNYL